MTGYFRFALFTILLVAIACLSAIITMQFAVHRTEVEVPDLRALPVDQATSRAAVLGLDLSVTQRFYSTVLPAGQVLLQSPAAGASVRRGWNIAVVESLGPDRIPIPNVVGKNERSAILAIRQKGLELGALAFLPSDRVAPGTVLAQDPAPLAKGAEQPSVSLLLASPPLAEPAAWVMPDEQGKPYKAAAAELTRQGLKVTGAPPPQEGAPATPGTVVGQSPLAGARTDAATPIVLFVAAQPPSRK